MMKIVALEQACAGERLARDLRNASGRLILAKGTVLTPALLKMLQNAEIKEIAVELQGAEAERQVQTRLAELEERFTGQEHCPFMQAIKQAVRAAILRGMGAVRNSPSSE